MANKLIKFTSQTYIYVRACDQSFSTVYKCQLKTLLDIIEFRENKVEKRGADNN